MNWSRGFTARYYGAIVDPQTWKDVSTFKITGGSIKLTNSSLRESADVQCSTFDQSEEYWIRIYLESRQTFSTNERNALFTGLACAPDKSFNGVKQSMTLKCNSVLKPAEDVLLPRGWFVRGSANGARTIYDLLKDVTPAPIRIDGISPAISKEIVAESGESVLTMVDYILDAINWRIKIEGDGTIVICEKANDYVVYIDADKYDILEMEVTIEKNWYDCPNVFRAICDDMMAIARDEDPNSRLSVQRRGREIWMEETSCTLNDGESIAEYANRRLEEEQRVNYSLSYNRRFHPDARPTDRIWIYYPKQDISGEFIINSQTIKIGYGAPVSEEVQAIV